MPKTDLESRVSVKLDSPFSPNDLSKFLSTVPASADVTVATYTGGSQRDPYVTGYAFVATWVN